MMKPTLNLPLISRFRGPFQPFARLWPVLRAHSSPEHLLHKCLFGHLPVRQSEQGLGGVLGQAAITYPGISTLALDPPSWMLELSVHTGLEFFELSSEITPGQIFLCTLFARTQGPLIVDCGVLSRWPFVCTFVASICEYNRLVATMQSMTLGDTVAVSCRVDAAVHQPRFSIDFNVGLYSEVSFIALLGLVYLGVTLPVFILGGARGLNQGGVHCGRVLDQQAFGSKFGIDRAHNLEAQPALLEQMAKTQEGALVGQVAHARIKLGKLGAQQRIVQGIFHVRIVKAKPVLHAVNAQHRFHRKRRTVHLPDGAYGKFRSTSSTQGAHRSISSGKSCLRVSLGAKSIRSWKELVVS
jgi:hypothetical protein